MLYPEVFKQLKSVRRDREIPWALFAVLATGGVATVPAAA
jgi:hypothetical protein